MRLKEEYRETTIIQKSKFIACVAPVKSEEEARAFIENIRKEFRDATHVCTAYAIGENNQIERSNDNKEPSGTAGIPMLESIRNSGLKDVCACVVRYFGGIKLGTGGLARAYSGAVTTALQNAKKVEQKPQLRYSITYDYPLSSVIDHFLHTQTNILETKYEEKITCIIECDTSLDFETEIQNRTKGEVQPTYLETTYKDVEITSS